MDSYGNPGSQHRCQPVWNSYQNSIYTATAVYPHTMAGVHGCVPGCIDPRTIGRVYFTDLLHGWTGEGAGIPLNSEVISTRSSTPHHAIHDGIASTARGAGGAHHGVTNAPRPRAYGPRASTDTRGDLPPRRDKPAAAKGLRRACPLRV